MYKENKYIYVLKTISTFSENGEKYFETLYWSEYEKQNPGRAFEKFNIIKSKINSYKKYKALYAFWMEFFFLME